MRFDCVVVGAGLAGMTAGVRLAEGGRRTVVLSKGIGSLYLGGATIDVLGYSPELVESPAAALPRFTEAHPEHPYARLAPGAIEKALAWLKSHLTLIGYAGGLDENLLLPTAVGAAKPSAVVPRSMASGDLRRGGNFLLVGFRTLKEFYPAYAADNLTRARFAAVDASSVELRASPRAEPETGALAFARGFDDPEFRKSVVAELEGRVESGSAVGFPAVLGLREAPTVWAEIQDALGAPVFEVATLPPSVPGIRVFGALKDALRRAGGRLITNAEAVGCETAAGRVSALVVDTGDRKSSYAAHHFVLATGGVSAGGIVMDSRWRFAEPVFGLPVAAAPPPDRVRFLPEYFGDHPAAGVGVATDDSLRPIDDDGNRVYDNLYVAGATLAGAQPWREKSGNGLSLATGWAAATAVLQEGGD